MANILIVEDNPANLELMVYLLNAFGHTTMTACDGKEALEILEKQKPDLIICDIHLPILDGYEVAKRLKKDSRWQMIPLVAVTALAMMGDQEKIIMAGFDNYITKPIEPEAFIMQLHKILPKN